MNHKELPQIGQPLNGGFFAGLIQTGEHIHAIIVAPKEAGTEKFPWGEHGKEIDAKNYSDGKSNTLIMAENGSQLAQWALALTINEFSDWYIPSRDELEIIYRNLKPTTNENCCSFRDGDNPSALDFSQRYPYTPLSPLITKASAFQKGNDEAFDPTWHWSSTQYSAHDAWIQGFADGDQGYGGKDGELAVRAVRRELVI